MHERYISPLRNVNTTGKAYYYTDFDELKLRLIVLNVYDNDASEKRDDRGTYEISEEQCTWLAETLKACEKKEYGVIIAAHEADEPIIPGSNDFGFCQRTEPYPWSIPSERKNHIVADLVDAFANGKSVKKEYVWEKSGHTVKVDCNFEKKSEFICFLNGHRHGDYIGYLPSYPGLLSLGMPCSGCFPKGYHNIGDEVSDLPRIPGTVSEDAVNFYVLDRENKTISVVRMGACVNDLFEERIAARFKYGE